MAEAMRSETRSKANAGQLEEIVTSETLEIAALKMELKQKEKLVEAANNLIKHVEEVVGIVKREIDKLESRKPITDEQYMILLDLRWFYGLLTEGSE